MYSEGDRNNPYSFDDFIAIREKFNYYSDDPFLQALLKKYTGLEFEKIDQELRDLSKEVSYRYRTLADTSTLLENRMKCTVVRHYDAFNHRVDSIERCAETETLEREIFDLGLFDPGRNTPWSRFAKMFLLYENGEFGVMCPIACTHGMIKLMEKYEQTDHLSPEAKALLASLRDGIQDGQVNRARHYSVGAQFLTEIQGGSDVAANLVEAVFEEAPGADGVSNCWRLYGKKYFCSAMQADVALVTAKPKNTPSSTKVAIFIVPSWLPGRRTSQIRNGATIDRLKQKLGTAELPTAEVTYHGAVGYPIGPLEKGLANVVGIVLTISRLHIALGSAAAGLRVAREAEWYAQFRQAFGVEIGKFPMLENTIRDITKYARRTAAGVFKVYQEYLALGEEFSAGLKELEQIPDMEERKRRFRLRELILLQKITTADEAPVVLRKAISIFGGHGVMEDFLSLPRLLRDAFIMELWEGPRNVLLTQIHRDVSRVRTWYPPETFCRDLLEGCCSAVLEPLVAEFDRIMSHESLFSPDENTATICRDWDRLSTILFNAYQDQALAELDDPGEAPHFSELLRH